MNDTVEQNLRAALSDLAASRSTDADARLQAIDYRPRSHRHLHWPVAGATATLVAAAAATTAVLLSSAAPEAFAGWTAVPTKPTAAALKTATALCNALNPTGGRLTGKPVLTEARDRYTAAIYVTPATGSYQACISDGAWGDGGTGVMGGQGPLRVKAAPGPDQLGIPDQSALNGAGFPGTGAGYRGQLPAWWSALTGRKRAESRGTEQNLAGLAGHNVRSVTLVFDRGVTVNATVENGWYFAWWPGAALPDTIKVTNNAGTTSNSPMPGTAPWNTACPQSAGAQRPSSTSKCGVFATGERPSAIRRQQAWLEAHPHANTGREAPRH